MPKLQNIILLAVLIIALPACSTIQPISSHDSASTHVSQGMAMLNRLLEQQQALSTSLEWRYLNDQMHPNAAQRSQLLNLLKNDQREVYISIGPALAKSEIQALLIAQDRAHEFLKISANYASRTHLRYDPRQSPNSIKIEWQGGDDV